MRHLLLPALQLNRMGYPKTGVPVSNEDFADTLVNDFSASEIYKLTDNYSGTTILAFTEAARNGIQQGWTLQNDPSPIVGDTGLAPYHNGLNSYGNIQTASLASIFNGQEGSLFTLLRVKDAAVWTSSGSDTAITLDGDPSNRIRVAKVVNTGLVHMVYTAGGVVRTINYPTLRTDIFSIGMSWSKTGDFIKGYVDGQPFGTLTGVGTFTGALSAAMIGALDTSPSQVWDGWIYWPTFAFGTVWSDADHLAIYTDAIS